jgi:hypothetical protein
MKRSLKVSKQREIPLAAELPVQTNQNRLRVSKVKINFAKAKQILQHPAPATISKSSSLPLFKVSKSLK